MRIESHCQFLSKVLHNNWDWRARNSSEMVQNDCVNVVIGCHSTIYNVLLNPVLSGTKTTDLYVIEIIHHCIRVLLYYLQNSSMEDFLLEVVGNILHNITSS